MLNSTLLQPMYLYITQYCLDYCGLYQVIQFTWFVIIQYNFKYCIFSTFSYKFQNKIFLFSHKKFVENVLLEIEKGKSLSCLLCNPRHCSLPGSTVHGILQARILEWVAILFSRGSSWPKDGTRVSFIVGRFFTIWATKGSSYVCVSRSVVSDSLWPHGL